MHIYLLDWPADCPQTRALTPNNTACPSRPQTAFCPLFTAGQLSPRGTHCSKHVCSIANPILFPFYGKENSGQERVRLTDIQVIIFNKPTQAQGSLFLGEKNNAIYY